MILIICLVLVILLVLLVRIRLCVFYGECGVRIAVKILLFKIPVYPKSADEKSTKQSEDGQKKKRGGSLSEFSDFVKPIIKTLGKAIAAIRIDKLNADVIIASDDAAKTAMLYGSAAAGCGIILPVLENNFKIKRKEITVNADFELNEIKLLLNAQISIAVWQLIRLGVIFVRQLLISKKERNV